MQHDLKLDFTETHISWVFMGEHEVFKVKKPVNFGFLDYSTLERRKQACEAEVRLNSRLAPDVYLGVVPITKSPDGFYFIGGGGEVVDWAVRMRRLSDLRRADVMLNEGGLGFSEIDKLAQHLAEFHEQARCDSETSRFGDVQLIEKNVRENFEQMRTSIYDYLSQSQAKEIEHRQLMFLRDNTSLFQSRIQKRRIRDGHGDLRLQQIYFEGQGKPTILDCIEFNDRFRYSDVCADIAFLSMDLRYHGRADLAEHLLACYARESNDFDLFELVDFYESYRAYVRGKVAHFLVLDSGISETLRRHSRQEARRYFLLSLAEQRPPLLAPTLIAVGGTLGSGKSTVSDWLGKYLSAPVINTDRTRKFLLGVPPTQFLGGSKWQRAYDPAFTENVYAELLRRAQIVLESGRSVIVDATFRSARLRAQVKELAHLLSVSFKFIECRAPNSVCRQRLLAREHEVSVSDARVGLLDEFSRTFEPIRDLNREEHIVLDTGQSFAETKSELASLITRWQTGLAA